MFSNIHSMSAAEASQILVEEEIRFPSFSASDAVTLGLSIRKRFRGTSRHAKGKGRGLVISVQSIAGHTLFCCTVQGGPSSVGDGMINVVKRTGHSSYYVEKGMAAMGKTPKQMGLQGGEFRVNGGAFPIWLSNAPCCPIGIAACYSGSSQDDHRLVSTTVRDYLSKLLREGSFEPNMHTPSTFPLPGTSEQPLSPTGEREDPSSARPSP